MPRRARARPAKGRRGHDRGDAGGEVASKGRRREGEAEGSGAAAEAGDEDEGATRAKRWRPRAGRSRGCAGRRRGDGARNEEGGAAGSPQQRARVVFPGAQVGALLKMIFWLYLLKTG